MATARRLATLCVVVVVVVMPWTASALELDTADTTGGLDAATDAATGTAGAATKDVTPVTDAVRRTARDTVDGAGGSDALERTDKVLEDPTGTVKDIVDGVVGRVRDTAGTAEEVTDTVRDTVDGQVQTIVDPAPDAPRDRGRSAAGGQRGAAGTGGGITRTGAATQRARSRTRADAAPDRVAQGGTGGATAPLVPVGHVVPAATADPHGSVADAIIDASRRFSFPLALAVGVLLFLAVQGRMDRNDPKLAADRDEELTFS